MATVIFFLAIISLIIALITIYLDLIVSLNLDRKKIMILFSQFVFSLSIISFYSKPGITTDLFSHYYNINQIRAGNATYTGDELLVIWQIILWVVAQTGNNGWLPIFSINLWGIFVGLIINSYLKNNKYCTKIVLLYFIALFGGCSIYHLVSGIRSALVVAISCYAILIWREKNFAYFLFLMLVASLIHIFGLLLFVLVLIHRYAEKSRLRTVIIFILLLIFSLFIKMKWPVDLLFSIPIPYIQLLAQKWTAYLQYSATKGSIENRLRWIWVIYFLILTIIRSMRIRKIDIFSWFVLLTIFLSPFTIFFERITYVIGILSLPILNENYLKADGTRRQLLFVSGLLICSLLFFYLFYSMLVHFDFFDFSFIKIIRTIF